MTRDYSHSVSYGSIVFTDKPAEQVQEAVPVTDEPSTQNSVSEPAEEFRDLDAAEQSMLLRLARQQLEAHFGLANKPEVPSDKFTVTPMLEKPLGVFVTLKKHGDLRGCIGIIAEGKNPLYKNVMEFVINSAVRDPRFPPMIKDEVDDVHIEISVMRHVDSPISPFKLCADINDITIGRDGLRIERGLKTGILLPQVPVEQNWDRAQYLAGICRKAGFPASVLADPETRLYTFSAQVFEE